MHQSEAPEGWPIPPEDAPTIGVDGRFRLAVRIGEGGMAVVYRAWDSANDQWVAVKVLLPEYARKRKLRFRFEREATTMLQLEHRHIVKVLAVGTEAERLPFIVMELADGGCVIDWVERYGPMPARMAVDVVMQACKGLKAAHDMGIVHRDVKPHNILITRRGVCRLTDFGIAQLETQGMTKTGSVMGTLGYMAPEQRTDSKNVDIRADIYGLGATLYKLITGGTVADLFLAEHDEDLMSDIPPSLAPVLLKATAYKPEARHGSVTELARELHGAKKNLDAIPDDTPSLAMPLPASTDLDLVTNSDVSEETFPEMPVGHYDSQSGPPDLQPPSAQGVSESQSQLPYTMPRQDIRVDDPDYIPDYIDRDSMQSARVIPEEIDVDEEEKRKQRERYQRAFEAGLIDANGNPISQQAAEEERGEGWNPADDVAEYAYGALSELAELLARPLQIAAVGTIIVGLVVGVVVVTGASKVNEARSAALDSRGKVYATVEAEQEVIAEVGELGGDAGMLETYWVKFQHAQTEQERMEMALKFVARARQTEQHIRQFGVDIRGDRLQSVRERVNRMAMAVDEYETRMLVWEEQVGYGGGRLATSLGVADAPEHREDDE